MLTREMILGARPKLERIDVPEWGGTAHVRLLTLAERDRLTEAHKTGKPADFEAVLIQACICDADGVPMFAPENHEALKAQPAALMDRLAKFVMKVNGLEGDAEKKE